MSNLVKILFFATLRDKTGVRETTLEIKSGTNILGLKDLLLEEFPNLRPSMETVIVAMNHEFAFDENPIPDGAEIALFPPVSGGMLDVQINPTIIAIVDSELDINEVVEKITLPTTGAVCSFTGIVRGETSRKPPFKTDELVYEAYQTMAIQKMKQIVEEIRMNWIDVQGIALIQRIGKLIPGDFSVVVACSSSHRDSGIFDAAKYGIDRLKEIVPIWKKEISVNGEQWIEGDYLPQRGE